MAHPWHDLPNNPDTAHESFNVVIEIPRGSKVHDPAFTDITDIDQLPPHMFAEIQRFFLDYKTLEDKSVSVDKIVGHQKAIEIVQESFALYRAEENRLRGWG